MPIGASFLLAATLALAPFSGRSIPGSVPGSTKFVLHVHGSPGATVRLRAVRVPKGYVASFCTDRVCSPFRVSLALPNSGRELIEVQLIENVADSAKPQVLEIAADDGHTAIIAFSRGTR
jgi:hypothetical protein